MTGSSGRKVIVNLGQVTPEWLTTVLTGRGALAAGVVQTFEAESQQSNWATIAKLQVSYSREARGEMPRRLVLKLVNAVAGDYSFGPEYRLGPSEVEYYTRDYDGAADVPLVRSYDAAYSPELQRYHVLMDDLSQTHVRGIDKPVTLEHGLALAEGLAAMHARWWGTERLREGGKYLPNAEQIDRFVGMARPGVEPIVEYCASELQPHWPDVMREIFEKHPRAMIERTSEGDGFTLIHGDVNRTNILVPIEGDRPLYVLDRQPFDWSLTVSLGTYDLSYPMVLWWDVETRRRYESAVLRRYHDALIKQGVRGYSMEQVLSDYRLSAVMSVYVATQWCRNGVREDHVWIWKPKLIRALTAFEDLECRSIWT